MFREKYFELKDKRKKFIIIMKNGIFYNVLGKDCYIIKNIFLIKNIWKEVNFCLILLSSYMGG